MLKKSGGSVTFIFEGESKEPVFLVGDFNAWNKSANKMTKSGKKWQTKLNLKPGRYAYKFFINNEWVSDNSADEYVTNPFGQQDSVLVVSEAKKVCKSSAVKKAAPKKTASSKKTTKKK